MVSIIKNQLLKHLSRFTKNLSADKINLSTFKGEGELTNLELDENVLTELLELPSWLRLTYAWCNRVSFRIQWTKLKSVPIVLNLDEVLIEVETCAELRSMSQQAGLSSYMSNPGKYSFIQKVIDGITVIVNTVSVNFRSPAFTASVQMSRITVESVSPTFQRCDLRMTRLKDSSKGQLLIFKELVWQTVRIEAQSTKDSTLTPLRLLTNQARCRITIKKRVSDCFVMGSRLVLILDDLLWVLTDSQLKAALLFLDSLAGLVQKATEVTRKAKAARKLEVLPEYQAQISQQARVNEPSSAISKIFARYDVIETSYHFLSQHIDLHLCDDPGDGRSCHHNLKDGGALQISLQHFQVDFYPYHLAASDRKHWATYRETNSPHTQWAEQALFAFKNRFMDLIDSGRSQHTPLSRTHPQHQVSSVSGDSSNTGSVQETPKRPVHNSQMTGNPVKHHVLNELAKLMTSVMVIRIQDFVIYKVTTTKKQTPKELITGDRDRYSLPEEMPILHAEFTYYYYPGDTLFPLPSSKFYVHINPVQINFDVDSCLWANSFALNLHKSLLSAKTDVSGSNLTYIDVKIEAIMPRVIFESTTEHPNQKDRPKSLQFQVSRALITNVRSIDQASRADLAKCIDTYHLGSLFFGSEFPSEKGDRYVVTDKFLRHIEASDNVREIPTSLNCNSSYDFVKSLTKEMFWTEAKDVWCINLEPVYGDFFGTRAVGNNKPVPFLDAFPLTLWVHISTALGGKSKMNGDNIADIHCLAHVSNLVSLQINHYQVLFLLRLTEELSELSTFLALDTNRIQKSAGASSLVLGIVLPQVEISVVMPSQSPGKESSGGDLESVVPDSSSFADDLLVGLSLSNSNAASSQCGVEHQTAVIEEWQRLSQETIDNIILSMARRMEALTGAREEPGGSTQWQSNPLQFENVTKRASLGAGNASLETPISEMSSSFSMDFPANDNITTQAGNTTKTSNGSILSKSVPSTQPFSNINISKDLNAGLSSVKKGFSSLMTSIDSAFKPGADDASDTMSVRSDVSSDSENYVVVNHMIDESCDAMFRVHNESTQIKASAVEVACEVVEEDGSTTPSEHSIASSYKRRDIVSMATFKLGKVELIHQSQGFNSLLKLQVSNVKCDECSAIPWDEFQNKFGSRARAWVEAPLDSSCSPCIKLRFTHDVKLERLNEIDLKEKLAFMKLFDDFIDVRLNNIDLELAMSTITGLADLMEDEVIREPVPLQVYMRNINLNLNEDRPPSNITSPGPVPIHLKIQEMRMSRDNTGVIVIEPTPTTSDTVSGSNHVHSNDTESLHKAYEELKQITVQLKSDNTELKRQLVHFERVSEENRRLRRSQEETDALRSCLSAAQDDVAKLLDEKKSLLDRIRDLTDELSYMELHSGKLTTKR